MLNVLTKTKPWMVASLLAATSIFGQTKSNNDACRSTPKPPEPNQAPMTAAYNATSRIDVRGCWDMYIDVAFIYWQPLQDNMEYGISSSGADLTAASNSTINFDTNYKPGFQVGLGMNFDYDNWDSYLQYTWFHNTNSNSSTAPAGGSILPMQGIPVSDIGGLAAGTASGSWHLKMDFADWQLARSYYVGTKLTFRPFFGARGAWIRQKYNVTYDTTLIVNNTSISWGLGPQVGLTANYMFGYGLRMFGDVNGDILFTRYRTALTSFDGTDTYSVSQIHINTVRPHANLDLGFGWGSYFDNNNWHFDLMASYGFQVFWNQNMFRHFTDDTMPGNSNLPNGDLYVQGLNLTARFDF